MAQGTAIQRQEIKASGVPKVVLWSPANVTITRKPLIYLFIHLQIVKKEIIGWMYQDSSAMQV